MVAMEDTITHSRPVGPKDNIIGLIEVIGEYRKPA